MPLPLAALGSTTLANSVHPMIIPQPQKRFVQTPIPTPSMMRHPRSSFPVEVDGKSRSVRLAAARTY